MTKWFDPRVIRLTLLAAVIGKFGSFVPAPKVEDLRWKS
jgi:hypothetical protein